MAYKMKRYDFVQTLESIIDSMGNDNILYISLKGHDLDDKLALKFIKDELGEWFSQEIEQIMLLEKKELAFSISRFFDGMLQDELVIDYQPFWRRGLGMCTEFKVKITFKEE